jgi:uncharacterized spore protein YtfJ
VGANEDTHEDTNIGQDAKGAVMNGSVNDLMEGVRQESEARSQALQRLLSGADSSRVFGQPVTAGDYTVIPAAEVMSGGGFGSGMGFGSPSRHGRHGAAQPPETTNTGADAGTMGLSAIEGAGGGGGGGGGAMGRPVAAIVLGPDGVKVKPVLDLTKLAITALAAWGAVATLSVRMWGKK